MSIGPVEAFWIVLNFTTLVLSVLGFLDARRSVQAVKMFDHHGPGIVAHGDQRREFVRVLTQLSLLSLAIPAAVRPGDTTLSLPIVALMAVAVLVFLNTAGDALDRRRLWREARRRGLEAPDVEPRVPS